VGVPTFLEKISTFNTRERREEKREEEEGAVQCFFLIKMFGYILLSFFN
jgi:hypothetical protein